MMRVFIPLGDTLNISSNHVEMEETGTRERRQWQLQSVYKAGIRLPQPGNLTLHQLGVTVRELAQRYGLSE
jgi:hypothetical protein